MVKTEDLLKIITYLCVLTGYAAVVQYVEIGYSLLFAGMLGVAIFLDYRRLVHIPRWLLNTASVAVLVFSFSRMTIDAFIEPILSALVVLNAIKLLENKGFRDYMQIYLISMFLLVGSSLVSFSALFILFFALLLVLATTSLILLAYFSQDPELRLGREVVRNILVCSFLICAVALPASTAFFVVLPRTNFPLLNFLNRLGLGKTGFSDRVELGGVSEIQEDSGVIFRAEVESLPERSLYWRGMVLDEFDGKSWRAGPSSTLLQRPKRQADGVRQTIYLEPYGNRYLFALDKPLSVSVPGSYRSEDLTYYLRRHVFERIRYSAVSMISDFLEDPFADTGTDLRMPADFSPKVRELVGKLTEGASSPDAVVSRLIRFLNRGDYRYSLVGLPESDQPIEAFLLKEKRGNCEYFASSLAVMLRISGIPARLVGGYKGGYYNSAGQYYLVLQKNAHVWVEAYLDGGWRRFDPTPYSPENPGVSFGNSLLLKLKLQLDLFNYYWTRLVVGYDFNTQLEMIRKLRESFHAPNVRMEVGREQLKHYGLYGLGTSAVLAALVLGVMRWRGRKERLLAKFQRRMARHGYARKPTEGLDEFSARVEDEKLRAGARNFVEAYQRVVYKDGVFTRDDVARLEESLKEL